MTKKFVVLIIFFWCVFLINSYEGFATVTNKKVLNEALFRAVIKGDVEQVKALLENGANPNAKMQDGIYKGSVPLHWATAKGYIKIVWLLISYGADIKAQDKYGRDSFYIAVEEGHIEIVKFYLLKGVNVNEQSGFGFTPLHEAVSNGYASIVKLLLINGANVNARIQNDGFSGWTPLHLAAYHNYPEIVKILLSYGADVNAKNKMGKTALQLAEEYMCTNVVKILRSLHN